FFPPCRRGGTVDLRAVCPQIIEIYEFAVGRPVGILQHDTRRQVGPLSRAQIQKHHLFGIRRESRHVAPIGRQARSHHPLTSTETLSFLCLQIELRNREVLRSCVDEPWSSVRQHDVCRSGHFST